MTEIHENQKTLTYGTSLEEATVAILLMHGRGATAESMLDLAKQLPKEGVAYLMPQASEHRWYPNSGFAALEINEPDLSSAWRTMEARLQEIQDAGIPPERIIIGGFSQGACLASEFTARHAKKYGGLVILSGALMGNEETSRDYDGSLKGTPVYIGGANNDPWVTEAQMQETADILTKHGGAVSIEIQDSSDHTIRTVDIKNVSKIITAALNLDT